MSTVIIALGCPNYTYFVVCCSLSKMGSTTIFLVQPRPRPLSLNCVPGVKVGLRVAVFYGFPYKLRPKPKIAYRFACFVAGYPRRIRGYLLLVSEPDPRKSGKEGLAHRLGWKCTLRNVRNLVIAELCKTCRVFC